MGGTGSGPQRKVKRQGAAPKLHTPGTLPVEARPYFRRVADRAATHGLTHADVAMLAQLATALWLADDAAALLATEGLVQLDPVHGGQRKHPAFTVWRAAVATADGLGKQFGLTPASRARLLVDEPDNEKSLAEVLFEEVPSVR